MVSRILFDKMSKLMDQPIIIEIRPGAGGNMGYCDRCQGLRSVPRLRPMDTLSLGVNTTRAGLRSCEKRPPLL